MICTDTFTKEWGHCQLKGSLKSLIMDFVNDNQGISVGKLKEGCLELSK